MSCHMFKGPSWPVKHYHGFWIFLQLGIRKQALEIKKKKSRGSMKCAGATGIRKHQKTAEQPASHFTSRCLPLLEWQQGVKKQDNRLIKQETSKLCSGKDPQLQHVAACCSTNHITSTVSAVSVIFWSASITSITGSAPSPPQALGVPQPIRCPGKSSVLCFQMFPDVSV